MPCSLEIGKVWILAPGRFWTTKYYCGKPLLVLWVAAFDKCLDRKRAYVGADFLAVQPLLWSAEKPSHIFCSNHLLPVSCQDNSPCARFHMRGLIAQSTRQVFGIKMMIHLLWRAWFSVRRRGNFGPLQMPSKSSVSIDQVITWCYHYHILMTNQIIWLLEVNWLLIGWGRSGEMWNILLKGQMMTSLWYIWRKDIYYDKMMMKLINDHPRKPGVIGKLSFESNWALIVIGHPRIAPAMRQYGLIWTKLWHYCQCFVQHSLAI